MTARRLLLVVFACGAALPTAPPVAGQISPGPLAAAHAELEGNRNCLQCHAQGQGVDPAKCLSCHGILAERIEAGRGLHAQPGYDDCRICHIDHHGREYELVWWGDAGVEQFDHRLTGEPLTGAHRQVACRDCHQTEHIAEPQRLRRAGKDLERTFLGLRTDCAGCHADAHRGQLADDCASCHSTAAFAPAPDFDHAAAAFALTGAHQRVECAECHREESDADGSFQRFKPVPHQECAACHQDPHRGSLGPRCSTCHATESWHTTPGFDHSRTRFPLTGRHRRVDCAACHRSTAGELEFRGLAFAACSDCHDDPHEARLGGECASCHVTTDWGAVADDAFDHGVTRFALEGAHATVECAACHTPDRPLRIAGFERCTTCHADEHLGQFARRSDGGACESCHSVEAFTPALFTEEDHRAGNFPLEGLHRGVACVECHVETTYRPAGGGPEVTTARFRFDDRSCAACHQDPHAGTVDAWLADGGCATCHTDAGWEISAFDHALTGFTLEGAHAEAACLECHPSAEHGGEARPLALAGTPSDCAECHDEPHGGQFDGRAGGCASCHSAVSWADLLFDHDRDSTYPLDGAHAQAPCASCHLPEPGTRQAADPGQPVVRYRPLPTRCEDCHSG